MYFVKLKIFYVCYLQRMAYLCRNVQKRRIFFTFGLYKGLQIVDNTRAIPQGHSSNGRTAVSKTDGCEFESYCPCHFSIISFCISKLKFNRNFSFSKLIMLYWLISLFYQIFFDANLYSSKEYTIKTILFSHKLLQK